MNLFRSEEHARNWSQYDPAMAEQLRPLDHYLAMFARDMFRARTRTDFISWLKASQARPR